MFPFIREDDFVLIKRVPLKTIQPNDAILFESEDKIKVCHSVKAIKENEGILWFYTNGYKSISYDTNPIRQDRVMGKVVALRRKNRVIDLTVTDTYRFHFYLDCFLAECIFYAKGVLAKVPQLKKIYRYAVEKKQFSSSLKQCLKD